MKKNKKPSAWKNELWNGLGELLLLLGAMGIGFGIMLLFPYEAIKDIPAELFFLLGGVVLLAVIGIAALIIHRIKGKTK